MLSGEGNKNDEKATIGLINNKATLHVHRTSFVLFFPAVLHDYNVKLPTVSLKNVGTLCCLLAIPMFVCKIWRVNCDKQHWEDEETDHK